jgi:transposase
MTSLRFSKAAADDMAILLAANVSLREIADSFHCHYSTVYRIKDKIEEFGEARPTPASLIGRPKKITAEALEGLLDWLLDNGSDKQLAYLDEMVIFLQEEYDIGVSLSTVSRALKSNNISQKVVSFVRILRRFQLI